MNSLTVHEIEKYDSANMLDRILKFPQQLQHAIAISKDNRFRLNFVEIANVCATGMGGSGISGDIVRSYVTDYLKVPFSVNRYYRLPNFIDEHSFVITTSYSGNTEETLAAYTDACDRKANIVCITSGGILTEMAKTNSHPIFLIPPGYPPRAALGYLMVPLLFSLYYAGLIANPEGELLETVELLKQLSKDYHPDSENDLPKNIACALKGKIPLIYASIHNFEAVAWRWKGQLSENSKVAAFCNLFPELNHNEIMGWGPLEDINRNFEIIYLKDRDDHTQIHKRMLITKEILENHNISLIEVESRGQSLIARIFSLIFLGDFVSLYLAVLNKIDPTPVKNIDYLKQKLNLAK